MDKQTDEQTEPFIELLGHILKARSLNMELKNNDNQLEMKINWLDLKGLLR